MWTWFFWGQWKKKKNASFAYGHCDWNYTLNHWPSGGERSFVSDIVWTRCIPIPLEEREKIPLFRYFQSPKNDSIHWIWDKGKGGGYHPVFSCYLTRLNMPLWNRAQMAQTGLDAFTRKHVCWIGASNTFRPAAGCWHRLNFHFRSNVTESCTRTAFCVHQKKKKCCVHQWYVNIFDCVLVSNDNRDCSLKLLCDDFFWLLNSSLSVTDKYCFYRVQLYPSSIKSPWTFIQSYQCYNPCSKMNVL